MTKRKAPSRNRLLILEADELVRGLIVRWLSEAGHPLADTDAAPSQVALVIADLPNPAQADAALQALRLRYGAPILAISARFGREAAASTGTARRLGVAKVLPKPFSGEELLAAVEDCLQGP